MLPAELAVFAPVPGIEENKSFRSDRKKQKVTGENECPFALLIGLRRMTPIWKEPAAGQFFFSRLVA